MPLLARQGEPRSGGALAFGWFGVKERDGVNATTGGGSIRSARWNTPALGEGRH